MISPVPRILIVEDEARIASFLQRGLENEGFEPVVAADAAAAAAALAGDDIDLVLLDLGLPDRDGVDLLAEARAAGRIMPVIVVTARDDVPSTVAALEAGADEYVTKPFVVEELVARIRERLRSAKAHALSAGGVVLDLTASEATVGGRRVQLTRRESELLAVFLNRPGAVLSREEVLSTWAPSGAASDLDAYLDRLAEKLGRPAAERVGGAGYRLPATTV